MKSFSDALSITLSHELPLRSEMVPLKSSRDRVLSEAIFAPFDQPRFDNSAVDGYAISSNSPEFSVIASIAAGQTSENLRLEDGQAAQVFTGASLPYGTMAVVMQEDVERTGDCLSVRETVIRGSHIRPKGQEFLADSKVFDDGVKVTPPVLATLAAMGLSHVAVYQRPRVGILTTGSELIAVGNPLMDAQIYESNSWALSAMLASLNFEHEIYKCADEIDEIRDAMANLLSRCDVLITCGGVSVGKFDFVREALTNLEFVFEVERVAMKPGKPFAFLSRKDGKIAFGLPGNPMSALVTFSLFVVPFLCASCGQSVIGSFQAQIDSEHLNTGDRMEFVPGTCEMSVARNSVVSAVTVGSHSIAGLTNANCLIQFEPKSCADLGQVVQVWPLPWM